MTQEVWFTQADPEYYWCNMTPGRAYRVMRVENDKFYFVNDAGEEDYWYCAEYNSLEDMAAGYFDNDSWTLLTAEEAAAMNGED